MLIKAALCCSSGCTGVAAGALPAATQCSSYCTTCCNTVQQLLHWLLQHSAAATALAAATQSATQRTKCSLHIWIFLENQMLGFKLKLHTFRWPWEAMFRVFNSFFKHPRVIGASLPTTMDIRKPHVMVTCTHDVRCNSALATPIRLESYRWRPRTNMCSVNCSYASL